MKRILLFLLFTLLSCSPAFAAGNIIDSGVAGVTGATNAETIAGTRDDVYLTPANVSSTIVHNSAVAYVSTSGTQTIDSNATFERLNEGAIAYTTAHLENFTHSDGRLVYTGATTRHFFVSAALTVQSGETAQLCRFRVAEGGVTVAGSEQSMDFTSQTKNQGRGLLWIVELATNEYIEIFGTSDTDADTFDIVKMVITVHEEE